jgi:hypothetical protein
MHLLIRMSHAAQVGVLCAATGPRLAGQALRVGLPAAHVLRASGMILHPRFYPTAKPDCARSPVQSILLCGRNERAAPLSPPAAAPGWGSDPDGARCPPACA